MVRELVARVDVEGPLHVGLAVRKHVGGVAVVPLDVGWVRQLLVEGLPPPAQRLHTDRSDLELVVHELAAPGRRHRRPDVHRAPPNGFTSQTIRYLRCPSASWPGPAQASPARAAAIEAGVSHHLLTTMIGRKP
jgi:hypothetical protein